MPSQNAPTSVPMKIMLSIGHSRFSKGRRLPPAASCQTLVNVDGMISNAAACAGSMASPSNPIATVGKPRPITPLTVPASRKVPITSAERPQPSV